MSGASARHARAEEELEQVLVIVREHAGLTLPVRTTPLGAVRREMRRLGHSDAVEYVRTLRRDKSVLDALVTALTVGETYFFREREQLDFIGDTVLPELARESAGRVITAWSAGCAYGEEAYSLAAVSQKAGCAMRVLGTDISEPRLERARRGEYGEWSFRGVPDDVRAQYFRPTQRGFEVLPAIRSRVEFAVLNLAGADWSAAEAAGPFDLILCRNTLIYLDGPTVARVARRLMGSLTPSGWLFLGASDPLLSGTIPCEVVLTGAGVAYRRRDATARPHAPQYAREPVKPAPLPRHLLRDRRRAAGPVGVRPAPPAPAAPLQERDAERAHGAYARRDYAGAAEAARREVDGDPGDVSAWVVLVRALANLGRLEEAGSACAAAHDLHRNSAELAYLHGMLLRESGRVEDAAGALRSAIYLDRALAIAHLTLGDVLAAQGDTVSARRAFRNAHDILARTRADDVVPATDGLRAGTLMQVTRGRLDYWQEREPAPVVADA